MGMENAIIINQSYFDGNKAAIDALNEFFSSGFKVKHFSDVNDEFDVDPSIERIINRLDAIDPTWLTDENRFGSVISAINGEVSKINPVDGIYESIVDSNNETVISAIDGYVGIKMLQVIADNFDAFTRLINGIYSFELFTKPSEYTDVLNKFTQFIQLNEIPDLDLEEKIFDEGFYIDGIFKNGNITLPDDMSKETELERMIARTNLSGDIPVYVDDENDAVQEAAEINFFGTYKPAHMKYSMGSRKFMVSKEFKTVVDSFISGLRKCNSTDDLKTFLSASNKEYAKMFGKVVAPFIVVKAITNPKKANVDFNPDIFKRYTDSYKSILNQNNGARRFENYDIYTTFKADKEGTIKFLEDFFKLKLINEPDASIANNTLLTLFNIFDSRIYLDITYNMASDAIKNEQTENQFVTSIRGTINKNSRNNGAYSKKADAVTDTETKESKSNEDKSDKENEKKKNETVTEYVIKELNKFGDMDTIDMTYCEHYSDIIEREIDSLGDVLYNMNISPYAVNAYIGESFHVINPEPDEYVLEANVTKRRESLQSSVASLMNTAEKIVEMDNKHIWNNNTLVRQFQTSTGMFLGYFLPAHGAGEGHANIKSTWWFTKKAIKGKAGSLTPEQIQTLTQLHEYVGQLWACVKFFWANPTNWTKKLNLFVSDKKSKRSKMMADICRKIVALKPKLQFIEDNSFVNESWNDGSEDFIYQEASTEANRDRLKTALAAVLNNMKDVVKFTKEKRWTNNEALSMFGRKTAATVNLKQLIKYCKRAEATAAGKFEDSQVSSIKSLREKCEEILKTAKAMRINPLVHKNIKASDSSHKIATLANDVLGMESTLSFINDAPVHDSSLPFPSKKNSSSEDETTTESYEIDDMTLSEFIQEFDEPGAIPAYMRKRLRLSDDKVRTSLEKADLPPDLPLNPINDLVDSIDAKVESAPDDDINKMLGTGFENSPDASKAKGDVVINITNNYTNSFNTDSNNQTSVNVDDHSTGKTSNNSDSSVKMTTNASKSKRGYNNNNSNDSVDTKGSKEPTLSNGKTIQEMFDFLDSKEPQSIVVEAKNDLPKEDLLTKSLDKDREKLPKQQENKKMVQKASNTARAVFKPIARTKEWLTNFVDSINKRDEDAVKSELIDNPSYRSALNKAMRLAIHAGLISVAFSLQPWVGVGALGVEGARLADRGRLRKEARRDFETEIKVLDEKIRDLESSYKPEDRDKKYKLMRLKADTEKKLIQLQKAPIKTKSSESYYY